MTSDITPVTIGIPTTNLEDFAHHLACTRLPDAETIIPSLIQAAVTHEQIGNRSLPLIMSWGITQVSLNCSRPEL
ncbi:MAG: hypothetical protein AAGF11_34390 [Myxococcota bacterium]